ncbi:2Fe-2S iron-sulfur cluster-binding protein [Pelagibacterium halotolerans]|uniref:2Fe-2S iron-sulfur cluster-binding protein n=1 Tax=Pelagibacterium halotolerans TaxID=531813 RepID=UPI00384B7C71
MPTITFIQPDGTHRTIEATTGTSLMQTAVAHGIVGIVGECGGSAMCATCHVLVAPDFLDGLPEISENESEMLDFAETERQSNSRLACQIPVSDRLEGLTVQVAGA